MDEKTRSEIFKEVDDLYNLHGDAIADFEKCRKFGSQMSDLLARLEELECYQLADRVMDVMTICSPKIGSHCDNSQRTKGMLERLRDRIKDS